MKTLLAALILMPALWLLPTPVTAEDITVFAAASLTDALGEIAAKFEAAGQGHVVASFASSSDLARQIDQGAPADLFLSADEQWADFLEQRGLLENVSRVNLLSNRLVLVAPADSAAAITIAKNFPLAEALRDGRLAVGDPDHVPAGIYAKAALQNLGIWADIEPKLARAASVRAALLFVERGDCPFGIVYLTDALADSKVKVVGEFPATSHPPIIYPAVLVVGRHSLTAVGFLHYLQTADAAAIFKRYGFGVGK